ncbi:hypothetical protein OS493_033105 [Desmophyllum pertusum]|uniref:Uncharacterized protein n=1 Tax=Desmophyllum pertusum TaxID=174260 RepID=A0A9W9YVR4_9CNID|nr:hypothetical protein OS493_033105 [Desmophyllum pertusum]
MAERSGGYRKCFCSSCQGCLRSRRTVYRHQKLFGHNSSALNLGSQPPGQRVKRAKFSDIKDQVDDLSSNGKEGQDTGNQRNEPKSATTTNLQTCIQINESGHMNEENTTSCIEAEDESIRERQAEENVDDVEDQGMISIKGDDYDGIDSGKKVNLKTQCLSNGEELMMGSDNESEFEDSGGEDQGINALKDTLEISESDSDQTEGCTESEGVESSATTTTNPEGEKGNGDNGDSSKEECVDQEEDKGEEKKFKFIRWICLLLLHLKLSYNLSNSMFTILLNLLYFIFLVIRHPLHVLFPKTINDLEIIANLKVLNRTTIYAVCPNPKCSALYNMNEISCERNGVQKSEICKKKIVGKRCNAELSFEKKLSFGRTRMVPYKTYPFLPPSEWIKTFFKQEQFLSLIRNRPEPSKTDYRDIWDGKILQQFMMDPEDTTRPLLKDKKNLALLLYLDFFNHFNEQFTHAEPST